MSPDSLLRKLERQVEEDVFDHGALVLLEKHYEGLGLGEYERLETLIALNPSKLPYLERLLELSLEGLAAPRQVPL